jgi:hypothetical protein
MEVVLVRINKKVVVIIEPVIFALNEIGTPEYIQKMLNDNKHHILNER